MTIRRFTTIAACVGITGLVLSACSSGSNLEAAPPVENNSAAEAADIEQCSPDQSLKVTYGEVAAESMAAAVENLQEQYPELEIDATPSPTFDYGELTQQIVADFAVGDHADVIMTGLGQMQFWVDTYNPVPIDVEALPDDYQTQFLGAGTARDGNVYLAPSQISAPAMAVNQTLLDEAGAGDAEDIKTYEDLLEVGEIVTEHFGEPAVAFPPAGLADWYSQGLVQNSGAEFVDEEGYPAFDSPEAIEALDIWSELGQRGLEAGVQAADPARDIFSTGTLPITLITTSHIATIEQGAEANDFEWTPIHLPSVDGVQDRTLPAGGNGFMVLSDDPCRAAFSQELVSELLEPEVVMMASGTQFSYIPVSTIARDELLASDAATPGMTFAWTFDRDLNQWGAGFPGEHTAQINDEMEQMTHSFVNGEETEPVVKETVENINGIIEGSN